jgi:hypothetical protein
LLRLRFGGLGRPSIWLAYDPGAAIADVSPINVDGKAAAVVDGDVRRVRQPSR